MGVSKLDESLCIYLNKLRVISYSFDRTELRPHSRANFNCRTRYVVQVKYIYTYTHTYIGCDWKREGDSGRNYNCVLYKPNDCSDCGIGIPTRCLLEIESKTHIILQYAILYIYTNWCLYTTTIYACAIVFKYTCSGHGG